MKQAIVIFKSEHRSISAVLQALKDLARRAQDANVRPPLHHPKEDLDAEDWRAIGAAFAANNDPIAGMRAAEIETLFARIAVHGGARS